MASQFDTPSDVYVPERSKGGKRKDLLWLCKGSFVHRRWPHVGTREGNTEAGPKQLKDRAGLWHRQATEHAQAVPRQGPGKAQEGLLCRTVQHTAVQRRNSSVHSATARHTASKAWAAQRQAGHRQPTQYRQGLGSPQTGLRQATDRAQAGHRQATGRAQGRHRQPKSMAQAGHRRGLGSPKAGAGA